MRKDFVLGVLATALGVAIGLDSPTGGGTSVGEGDGELVGASAGDGDDDGDDDGDGLTGLRATAGVWTAAIFSSLVKYRKPPTPIALRLTTVTTTGHIQSGADRSKTLIGFLTCGVE